MSWHSDRHVEVESYMILCIREMICFPHIVVDESQLAVIILLGLLESYRRQCWLLASCSDCTILISIAMQYQYEVSTISIRYQYDINEADINQYDINQYDINTILV